MNPFDCKFSQLTGSFWLSSTNIELILDYEIGSGLIAERFRYVNDNSLCDTETYEIEYKDPGTGVWGAHDGSIVNLSAATPSPGVASGVKQVEIEIQTADNALDPGGVLQPKEFRIAVSSPDRATANGGALNPLFVLLTITVMHPCRFATFTDQVITGTLIAVIDGPVETLSIPAFTHDMQGSGFDCGLQSITIREDGSHAYPYSAILTGSAQVAADTESMLLSLSSSDDSHEGDHYPKIIVSLVTYPSVEHTNIYDFLVRLKPSCKSDVYTSLVWVANGSGALPQFTHIIEEDSVQYV